jgi:hypothetical protein
VAFSGMIFHGNPPEGLKVIMEGIGHNDTVTCLVSIDGF